MTTLKLPSGQTVDLKIDNGIWICYLNEKRVPFFELPTEDQKYLTNVMETNKEVIGIYV